MNLRHLAQLFAPLLAVVVAWFGLVVVRDGTPDAEDRLDTTEADVAARTVQLGAAERAAADRAALLERQGVAGVAVPGEVDIASFVAAVDAEARRAGVVVENLTPSIAGTVGGDGGAPVDVDDVDAVAVGAPTVAGASAVTVTLGARGDYEGLLSFVEAITAGERLVVVDRLELHADEESTNIILDLDLRIFTTATLLAPVGEDPLLAGLDDEGLDPGLDDTEFDDTGLDDEGAP